MVTLMNDFMEHLYEELGDDKLFFVKVLTETTMRIPGVCWYCGAHADATDHTVPVTFLVGTRNLLPYNDKFTLPCCHECNSTLGSRVHNDLVVRRKVIRISYRKKYKNLLKPNRWSFMEVASLEYNLQTQIADKYDRRKVLLHRLKNLNFGLPEPALPIEYTSIKPLMWLIQEQKARWKLLVKPSSAGAIGNLTPT
jgi:hypothetical protein